MLLARGNEEVDGMLATFVALQIGKHAGGGGGGRHD